jgi:hypothetical protein
MRRYLHALIAWSSIFLVPLEATYTLEGQG